MSKERERSTLDEGSSKPEAGLSRRALIAGAAAAGGAALLASCTSGDDKKQAAGPAVVTERTAVSWKMQTAWQPGTVGADAFQRFIKMVDAMSGGRFKIEPFLEGAIVGTFEMFDAVKNGVFPAMHVFPLYWAGKLPVTVFMSSFPLGPDSESQWEWFYGAGGALEVAREAYAQQGLYWVGPIQHGPNFMHSKVPIRTFEDFAGKKIRYPGGIVAEVFSAAGVSTVLLPGGEIYPALEKGVIDGADFVGPAINFNLGFAEVTKYLVRPALHQPVDLMDITVNMKAWEGLPEELQQILVAATKWHSWDQWSHIRQADEEAFRKFRERGVEIIELAQAEVDKFRKLAIPLWYKWAKKDLFATRIFKIWIDYLLQTGFVRKEWVAGESL